MYFGRVDHPAIHGAPEYAACIDPCPARADRYGDGGRNAERAGGTTSRMRAEHTWAERTTRALRPGDARAAGSTYRLSLFVPGPAPKWAEGGGH